MLVNCFPLFKAWFCLVPVLFFTVVYLTICIVILSSCFAWGDRMPYEYTGLFKTIFKLSSSNCKFVIVVHLEAPR